MKRLCLAILAMIGLLAIQGAANARVRVHIDLSTQRMTVQSSTGSYVWPVSTARAGYVTPRGAYAPTLLKRMHYSRKYDMSPMPHSIFFRGGYAIHGSYATRSLGRPASHGCVRLSPGNAAKLFQMVQREGASISITGSPPGRTMLAKAHSKHKVHVAGHRTKAKAHYAKRGGYAPAAYAPAPRAPTVKYWQRDPAGFFWR